jgi:hypothetical protein
MDRKTPVVCLCLLLPALTLAADPVPPVRTYDLPGHGRLEISPPGAWKEEVGRPPGDLPPTIEFSPPAGNRFSVQITPLFSPAGDPDYNRPERIRPLLEEIGRKQLEASVEKEITLKEIKGPAAAGYYFTVTDRAPKTDEWTYLTAGAAGVGDLLVSFTILTNSLDSGELRQALRMIESCRQIKSTDKPPVPPGR